MMRQAKPNRALSFVLSTVATFGLAACSGAQQDEEDLDAEYDQQSNLGEDDAAEGNGQENFVDNNSSNQYSQEQGADVNSDTSDEEFSAENPTLDDSASDMGMAEQTTEPAMNSTMAPPMNAAMNPAMDPAMNSAPVNSSGMAQPANYAPAPAAAPTGESPIPGGRVRYVREGGIQVMNAPGGTPVLTLDQGEHPVTWEENGWLRITNGMYVPVDGMSDAGVPRLPASGSWTH